MLQCGKLYRAKKNSGCYRAILLLSRVMLLAIAVKTGSVADGNFKLIAAPPETSDWLTGSVLESQLESSSISVRLSGQELRASLLHLAEAYEVAMFLDRQIDPSQLVDLHIADLTLEKGLQQLAEQHKLGLSRVGSVVYFGPLDSARDLRTLAALARDEVDQVPKPRQAALLKPAPLAWRELSTPRDLIEQTAKSAGLKLIGLERVPHDLWPAGSWPSMSVTERLTLLAIGFDLQVRVSKAGDAVALVKRVSPARLVKSYTARTEPGETSRMLAKYLPEAEFKAVDGKLFVRARWEDHQQVQAVLRGQPLTRASTPKDGNSAQGSDGIRVYTLSVQNKPLLPVLETLAKQMNLMLQLDAAVLQAAGLKPDQLISFQVKEVQRDELWEAALSPLGLAFKIDGTTITVSAMEKKTDLLPEKK